MQQGNDLPIGTIVEVQGPVIKILCNTLPPMHQALALQLIDTSSRGLSAGRR